MPGDPWQKFANLRLLYTYMWTHPGKKMLFMGCEFGQTSEWDFNRPLHWELLENENHRGLQKLTTDLNRIYQSFPELHANDFETDGFSWIDCNDREKSLLSFIRIDKKRDDFLVVICNFTPEVQNNYRIGVPKPGLYSELLNSDSEFYGGSNVGNGLGATSQTVPHQNQPYSIQITLPPLAGVILKPTQS